MGVLDSWAENNEKHKKDKKKYQAGNRIKRAPKPKKNNFEKSGSFQCGKQSKGKEK